MCVKVTVRQAAHFNNNVFAVSVIIKGPFLMKNEGKKVSGFGLGSTAYPSYTIDD